MVCFLVILLPVIPALRFALEPDDLYCGWNLFSSFCKRLKFGASR